MAKPKLIDVDAIDAFLARPKFLDGPPPIWKLATRAWEHTAQWILNDDLGISVGKLRFKMPRESNASDSVIVIFRERPIWRIDLSSKSDCEPNPPDAAAYGLPAFVCGPHEHTWADNRTYIAETGASDLPYRRVLAPQIRKFNQILPYLGGSISLTITPEQRSFDNPAQSELLRATAEEE